MARPQLIDQVAAEMSECDTDSGHFSWVVYWAERDGHSINSIIKESKARHSAGNCGRSCPVRSGSTGWVWRWRDALIIGLGADNGRPKVLLSLRVIITWLDWNTRGWNETLSTVFPLPTDKLWTKNSKKAIRTTRGIACDSFKWVLHFLAAPSSWLCKFRPAKCFR